MNIALTICVIACAALILGSNITRRCDDRLSLIIIGVGSLAYIVSIFFSISFK